MMLDRVMGSSPAGQRPPLWAWLVPSVLLLPLAGLWLLSSPPHARDRLQALEGEAASVARASAGRGDLKAYPAGTVCSGELTDAVKTQMNVAVANTGMQIAAFDIAELGEADSSKLTAYRLSFKGSGSYEDALAALDALNRAHPKLFIDSLALRNHVSDVELDLEGRLFCR